MVAIVNRTPTGRLISLHTEIKYLKARFGNDPFELKGLKYDSDSEFNPLNFFPLAVNHPTIGLYDPYLNNPLSPAKFHLTQSIQYDSQKSKSASECLNALEALGWIQRLDGGLSKLTEVGLQLASIKYDDEKFLSITRASLLGYGVFVGFLFKCVQEMNSDCVVSKSKIIIGYNDTHETISGNGSRIPLSTGSQKDTIVRTRATLFAWAITAGFAYPKNLTTPTNTNEWHIEALNEIKKKHWGWNNIQMFIPEKLFESKHYVNRPLSYRWMTKSTKALRERGQDAIRQRSLESEIKVKNRRLAIVYALSLASKENKKLNFNKLLVKLAGYKKLFVLNSQDFTRVMKSELDIATVAGIPFNNNEGILIPLTILNNSVLTEDAPVEVLRAIEESYSSSNI